MRLLSILPLCIFATAPCDAQGVPSNAGPTAGQLVQQCHNGLQNATISDPACVGYLAGFVGAVRIGRGVSNDFPICLPDQPVTNEQIMADVSDYLDDNPGKTQSSARSVVFLVLTQRFPCAQAGQ